MNKILLVLIIHFCCSDVRSQSWMQINSPTNQRIKACSFISQDTGWIVTADLIYKTTDGGLSWISQSYPPDPPDNTRFFNSIHFINSGVGIIACGNYLYSGHNPALVSSILWTDDGGNNWVYKDLGNIDFDSDAKLVSATTAYSIGSYGERKKTIDGGATWTRYDNTAMSGLRLYPLSEDTVYFAGLENLIIKGAFGKTLNGGVSWNDSVISTNSAMHAIYFTDYNNGWIGGYGGEIKYTIDAGFSWATGNTGTTSQINDMTFSDSANGWAVTISGEILHSTDGGLNWSPDYDGTSALNAIAFTKPNHIGYAMGDSGKILKYMINSGMLNSKKPHTIKLIPNPFKFSVTLQSDRPFDNANITLKNNLGQVVREMNNVSGMNFTLTRDDLPCGVYFIYVYGDKAVIVDKLIVSD